MEPEDKKNGIDYGDEDKTIVAYTKWKNPPKDPDDLQKALNWIQNEIINAFFIQIEKEYGLLMTDEEKEILYGKENGEKPQEIIYGISSIQQARESLQRMNLIKACICCRHWKIDVERTYLLGTCQQTLKDISYDRVCDHWEKIDREDNVGHK